MKQAWPFDCPSFLPDIVESKGDPSLIKNVIVDGLEKLEKAGCDLISVPCNTVFAYMGSLQYQILSIIEETADFIRARKFNKIGMIATKNTIKNKLYENALDGIEILQLPEASQVEVNDIIVRILSGEKRPADKERLQDFIEELSVRDAEGIVLGCTDLSLLISQGDSEFFLIDTLSVLAEAVVKNGRID